MRRRGALTRHSAIYHSTAAVAAASQHRDRAPRPPSVAALHCQTAAALFNISARAGRALRRHFPATSPCSFDSFLAKQLAYRADHSHLCQVNAIFQGSPLSDSELDFVYDGRITDEHFHCYLLASERLEEPPSHFGTGKHTNGVSFDPISKLRLPGPLSNSIPSDNIIWEEGGCQ